MAVPDIQKQLDDIAAMNAAFVQPSCASLDPMVKYPTTGTPPTLDFTIPQATKFTTYGQLVKNIDQSMFKPFTKAIPANNFFSYVKTLTPQAVTQLFHPNVAAQPAVLGQFVPLAGQMQAKAVPGLSLKLGTKIDSMSSADETAYKLVQAVPNASPASPISNLAQQGIRGFYTHRIMTGGATIKYMAAPFVPVPRITVIEEYTTASYLGNYGAGRVVKTFTLLPGEKTTISVRTYKDSVTTASKSQNVLDSFSDSSATELDNLLQQEQGSASSFTGTEGGNSTSYSTFSDSHNTQSAWNISAKLSLGDVFSVGGGYGRSSSDTSTSSGGFADATNYSNTTVRAANMAALSSAMEKHVQQSNAYRQVNVNTNATNTVSAGEENLTIREIQNVNLNNVLNFTYRQLLQQYTTLTWLSGLKFAYTNGYPESYKVVNLPNLRNMLTDIIIDSSTLPTPPSVTYIDQIMCLLLKPYCGVLDYTDTPQVFVEAIENVIGGCLSPWLPDCEPETELIWRKAASAKQKYDPLDITVDGIILSVQDQTLLTSSIIGDALLGKGDALDCYNQKVQSATATAGFINNLRAMQQLEADIQAQANNQDAFTQNLTNEQAAFTQNLTNDQSVVDQKLDIINQILTTPDAISAATLYKKVNGDCCDVPQNTDCGCND